MFIWVSGKITHTFYITYLIYFRLIFLFFCRRVPGEIEIMMGSNEITGGQYYLVEKIIIHENYDKYTNNIAVAKVKGSIKTNKKVRVIPITRQELPDGRQIEITGWGKLGMALPHPTHLQLSEVKAASTPECQKRLPFVDDSTFCSFHKDHEFACQVMKLSFKSVFIDS